MRNCRRTQIVETGVCAVLAAGGYDRNSTSLASAELYDPVTGRWTPTGALTTIRQDYQMSNI